MTDERSPSPSAATAQPGTSGNPAPDSLAGSPPGTSSGATSGTAPGTPSRSPLRPPLRGVAKWAPHLLWLIPLVMVGLFVLNGIVFASGNQPLYALTMAPPLAEESPWQSRSIKVLTWDLDQCGARKPGLGFVSKKEIRDRLIAISEVIDREKPDVVVLLNVLTEFTLCNLNQPRSIAEATGMHCWAWGETFQVGLPFLRVTGGNAILSRRPLQVMGNFDLPGGAPFFSADPARRSLWCQIDIDGRLVRIGAIRLSAESADVRLAQARWLVEATQGEPSLLAGNFQAEPGDQVFEPLTAAGQWGEPRPEPATYPAGTPRRRLDHVLAPAGWELLREEVLDTDLVLHRPVLSEFRLPAPAETR